MEHLFSNQKSGVSGVLFDLGPLVLLQNIKASAEEFYIQ